MNYILKMDDDEEVNLPSPPPSPTPRKQYSSQYRATHFQNSNGIQVPAKFGLFATRDLISGEKIVLFTGIQKTIESYNKSVLNGVIEPGYAHYINNKYVYCCYSNYKSNKCLASAANSHLNYFDKDGNNYINIY